MERFGVGGSVAVVCGAGVERGAQPQQSIGTMVSFRLAAVFAALTVVSGERFNEIKVSEKSAELECSFI